MVPEITRLWLHTMIYSRENKYKDRYLVKKKLSKYTRWQQKCTNVERRIMDKKNGSWNNYVAKKHGEKFKFIGRNIKKQH